MNKSNNNHTNIKNRKRKAEEERGRKNKFAKVQEQ